MILVKLVHTRLDKLIANLNLPHLYLVPKLGVTSLEFCRYCWH